MNQTNTDPRRRAIAITTVCYGAIVGLGFVRFLTGPDYSFSLFFFAPVVVSAWFVGRSAGVGAAILSASVWLVADLSFKKPYLDNTVPYINETLRLGMFLLLAVVFSSLKRSFNREHMLAVTDDLTGLLNRRGFLERATHELERSRRFRRGFTMIYVDVDHFKSVNDHHGHEAGDQLLAEIGTALKAQTRVTDVVARLGGDEFVALLPETHEQAGRAMIARLEAALEAHLAPLAPLAVGLSIGLQEFATAPADVYATIAQTDRLMYQSKKAGGGRITSPGTPAVGSATAYSHPKNSPNA